MAYTNMANKILHMDPLADSNNRRKASSNMDPLADSNIPLLRIQYTDNIMHHNNHHLHNVVGVPVHNCRKDSLLIHAAVGYYEYDNGFHPAGHTTTMDGGILCDPDCTVVDVGYRNERCCRRRRISPFVDEYSFLQCDERDSSICVFNNCKQTFFAAIDPVFKFQ